MRFVVVVGNLVLINCSIVCAFYLNVKNHCLFSGFPGMIFVALTYKCVSSYDCIGFSSIVKLFIASLEDNFQREPVLYDSSVADNVFALDILCIYRFILVCLLNCVRASLENLKGSY